MNTNARRTKTDRPFTRLAKSSRSRFVAELPTGMISNTTLLLLYLLLTLIGLLHHEPWRDEADVWLCARDASPAMIFSRASHTGTPIFWNLLIWPLPRVGLPYWSMGILHLLIAAAAVAVFVWRAPFPRLTKVLFVFSYYMLFEYAVIARPYALTILTLFLIAALYPERLLRPVTYGLLLGLLFLTTFHSFLIGSVLGGFYLAEVWRTRLDRRWPVTTILMGAATLTVFQLLPAPGEELARLRNGPVPAALLWATQAMFFPMVPLSGLSILTFAFLAILIWSLWSKPRLLVLLVGIVVLLLSLFVFQWSLPDGYRHFGLLLITVIMILWMEPFEPARPGGAHPWEEQVRTLTRRMLNVGLVCLGMVSAFAFLQEIRYDFSGSRRMAEYLLQADLGGKTIVAHQAAAASAVLPYLPDQRFWYPGPEAYGTYLERLDWYAEGDALPYEEAIERMRRSFGHRSDVLLLLNAPLSNPQRFCLRLRYSTQARIWAKKDERYYLYEPAPAGSCERSSEARGGVLRTGPGPRPSPRPVF